MHEAINQRLPKTGLGNRDHSCRKKIERPRLPSLHALG